MKLTLLRGLPGSGKSTLALQMVGDAQRNMEEMVRLEADLFHTMSNGDYVYKRELGGLAHQFCQSTAAFYLNKGIDVVVANTFISIDECKPYVKIALLLGAEIDVIECDGNYEDTHNVPAEVKQSMADRWEDFTLADLMCYYSDCEIKETAEKELESLRANVGRREDDNNFSPWWKFWA